MNVFQLPPYYSYTLDGYTVRVYESVPAGPIIIHIFSQELCYLVSLRGLDPPPKKKKPSSGLSKIPEHTSPYPQIIWGYWIQWI